MRRLLTLLVAFAGCSAIATPAAAQALIAPLPSGVTLRVNGPGSNLVGVLYQQSLDSVWLRPRGKSAGTRSIAVSQVVRVDQAHPEYVKSILIDTGIGALVGAALYPITSHNDHDVFIGLSVIGGAVAGLLFPHTAWIPVPLH